MASPHDDAGAQRGVDQQPPPSAPFSAVWEVALEWVWAGVEVATRAEAQLRDSARLASTRPLDPDSDCTV